MVDFSTKKIVFLSFLGNIQNLIYSQQIVNEYLTLSASNISFSVTKLSRLDVYHVTLRDTVASSYLKS